MATTPPTARFRMFNSVQEFVDTCAAETTARVRREYSSEDTRRWTGHTWQEAHDIAKAGDIGAVPKAEEMLDKIDAEIDTSGLTPRWEDSVVGAFANVPAYLAGAPESMRNKRDSHTNKGEVNVYYSSVTSADIKKEMSYDRGITMLALVMALQRVRAVNLYYFTTLGKAYDHVVKVQTNPMVMSEAAHVLTSTSFYRNLSYGMATTKGWKGGWARWSSYGNDKVIVDTLKRTLDLADDDVVIPTMHRRNTGMMADPVKYINGHLDRYRGR